MMTMSEAVKLLKTERECVRRNDGKNCNRDCAHCDLVQDSAKLEEMYDFVIFTLEFVLPDLSGGTF